MIFNKMRINALKKRKGMRTMIIFLALAMTMLFLNIESKGMDITNLSSTLSSTDLITSGSVWKYFDQDSSPGSTWTAVGFNDGNWSSGNAKLGYNDNAVTEIAPGASASTKYITAYFRKSFNYTDDGAVHALDLEILRDDGAVVYINGSEVARSNMPSGTISHSTRASSGIAGSDESTFFKSNLSTNVLVNGTNVIAVEIHQVGSTSSDMAFDLKLSVGSGTPKVSNIRFGSTNTPLNGLTVTWQNSAGTDKIKWGYTQSFEKGEFSTVSRADYSNKLYNYTFPALQANSTIYYSIYNDSAGTWGPSREYETATDSSTQYTFTVGGDSRSNVSDWKLVADNWDDSDLVLFVGDIISTGSNSGQWENWYSYGENFISKNLVYHTKGNHDNGGIYENQFALPGNGLYYAFEYGNAVFICLNSELPSSSTQTTWLENTLSTYQNKTWKFVFFHKPFFTTGSHENDMTSYLNTWWKLFDDYGVNMIFGGHDHNYQRTSPINRNVNTSQPVAEYGSGASQGRCQIVTGGAGAPLYSPSARWWTAESATSLHFCVIEVNGNSLTCTVKDENQTVIDLVVLSAGGDNAAPTADFSANETQIEEGDNISFTDSSTNNPTSWSWSFPGGTPSTSTSQNPSVTYNTAGTYNVTLTATNADGSDTKTKNGYITVTQPTTQQYTLTLTIVGQGSVSPNGGTFDSGTVVTLTATPTSGWEFSNWSGATTNGTVTMTGNLSVTATFTEITTGTPMTNKLALKGASGGTKAKGVVTVLSGGAAVQGAVVNVTWSGSHSGSAQLTTNSKGKAKFLTPILSKPWTCTFTINSITKSGYTWDTASSVLTKTKTIN